MSDEARDDATTETAVVDSANDAQRAGAVRELIHGCSVGAAAATLQPVPLLDIALITPIQIGMVQGIGRIRGYQLGRRSVLEILRSLRASMVTQNAVIAAAKLVPAFGWFVSVSVAYALTYALGEVADRYFLSGRRTPASELKRMFKDIYKQKRSERARRLRELTEVRRELDALTKVYEREAISEEEFARRKRELLARV